VPHPTQVRFSRRAGAHRRANWCPHPSATATPAARCRHPASGAPPLHPYPAAGAAPRHSLVRVPPCCKKRCRLCHRTSWCRSLEDCAQGLGCRKLVGGGEASGARSCAVTGLRLGFQLVQCSGYGAAERNSFWCQETGHRPPSFGLVTDHQMGTCRFDSQVRPRSGRAPAWAPCPCLTQALRGAGRLHSRRRWQSAAPQQLKHRLAAQLLPPAPTWWLAACACMPALRRQHGASGRQQS